MGLEKPHCLQSVDGGRQLPYEAVQWGKDIPTFIYCRHVNAGQTAVNPEQWLAVEDARGEEVTTTYCWILQ